MTSNALCHTVVERSWKIKGRVGQFSSVKTIFFSYHPVNYNSNVKDIYVWKSAKCFLLQCPLWQMRALLGSSADGGKTLEPNSNYSISKGHIHTHIHTQHTHTQPSTPIFTHLNTRNYTVTAQDLKLINAWCYLDHRLSDCILWPILPIKDPAQDNLSSI